MFVWLSFANGINGRAAVDVARAAPPYMYPHCSLTRPSVVALQSVFIYIYLLNTNLAG